MRRTRLLIAFFAIAGILIVQGARAQHEQQHPEQATPEAAPQAGSMMSGGMMSGGGMTGGMAMCQQMMAGGATCLHKEMKSLAEQAATSFEAIENESDATLLRTKLAEHGALLKKLQAKSQERCPMMESMKENMQEHRMSSPMRGGEHTKE